MTQISTSIHFDLLHVIVYFTLTQTLFKKSKESTDVSAILGVQSSPSKVSAKRKKDDDDDDDEEEEITGFSFGKGGGTGASTSVQGVSPAKRAAESPVKKVKNERNGNNSNSPSPRKVGFPQSISFPSNNLI